MDEKEKQKNLNEQLGELCDMIDQENIPQFSIKSLQKPTNKFKTKWFILLVLLIFICLFFILSNDQLSYNIYFVILSFIRLLLLQVNEDDIHRRNHTFLSLDSSLLGLDNDLYKSMFHRQSIL